VCLDFEILPLVGRVYIPFRNLSSPTVRSGHGKCETDGTCDCSGSWSGKNCYYYESGGYQYMPSSSTPDKPSKSWADASESQVQKPALLCGTSNKMQMISSL